MAVSGAWVQMWEGKLANVQPTIGKNLDLSGYVVEIAAIDPTYQLEDIEFLPTLMLAKRIDEGIAAALDSGQWLYPYNKSGWLLGVGRLGSTTRLANTSAYYDLETSQVTLAYIGDHLQREAAQSIAGFIQDLVGSEGGGRFFWDGRTSKFRFHSRYHDVLQTSAATITNSDVIDAVVRRGDDIANVVRVRYTQRTTGTAGSVLASNSTSFTLRAGAERKIRLTYKDPSNEAARCAGTSVITPVDGVDVVYTGGSLTISSKVGATATEITLTNGSATDATVTLLQVRGTPLLQYDTAEVIEVDVDSIANYDRRERTFAVTMQDPDEAQRYAKKLINRFKTPSTRLESIAFLVEDGTGAGWAKTMQTGNTISFEDDGSSLRGDYVIVGEQHSVSEGGATHHVRYLLKAKAKEGIWIVGSSALGRLGSTTILG
jgi:hypothetical protein